MCMDSFSIVGLLYGLGTGKQFRSLQVLLKKKNYGKPYVEVDVYLNPVQTRSLCQVRKLIHLLNTRLPFLLHWNGLIYQNTIILLLLKP